MMTWMTMMTGMIREEYDRMFALGVSMYGQMTAGSYCYIGPQVIIDDYDDAVHNGGVDDD